MRSIAISHFEKDVFYFCSNPGRFTKNEMVAFSSTMEIIFRDLNLDWKIVFGVGCANKNYKGYDLLFNDNVDDTTIQDYSHSIKTKFNKSKNQYIEEFKTKATLFIPTLEQFNHFHKWCAANWITDATLDTLAIYLKKTINRILGETIPATYNTILVLPPNEIYLENELYRKLKPHPEGRKIIGYSEKNILQVRTRSALNELIPHHLKDHFCVIGDGFIEFPELKSEHLRQLQFSLKDIGVTWHEKNRYVHLDAAAMRILFAIKPPKPYVRPPLKSERHIQEILSNPDRESYTDIHWAATAPDSPQLKSLLEENESLLWERTSLGLTPFLLSVKFGQIENVSYLLKNYFNLIINNTTPSGDSALHLAIQNKNTQLIKLISEHVIKQGGNINDLLAARINGEQKTSNYTLFHHCASNANEVNSLLSNKEDLRDDSSMRENNFQGCPSFENVEEQNHIQICYKLNLLISVTDNSGKTIYYYDNDRRLKYEIESDGYVIAYYYFPDFALSIYFDKTPLMPSQLETLTGGIADAELDRLIFNLLGPENDTIIPTAVPKEKRSLSGPQLFGKQISIINHTMTGQSSRSLIN